ncbi:MAG: hypothetical protein KGN76_04820 [Acidobacteriota bacterium]|nr:hypothetical protein [Acidobacteriota bacterium]
MKSLIAWQLCRSADALVDELHRLAMARDSSVLMDDVSRVVGGFVGQLEAWLDRAHPGLTQHQQVVSRIYALRAAEEEAVARLRRLEEEAVVARLHLSATDWTASALPVRVH